MTRQQYKCGDVMHPRAALRRFLIFVLLGCCCYFLALYIPDPTAAGELEEAVQPVHRQDLQTAEQVHEDFEEQEEEDSGRPWYMSGGTRRPHPAPWDPATDRRRAQLWPHEAQLSDRITQQLMFVPRVKRAGLKKILLYNGLRQWSMSKGGQDVFLQSNCPVNSCTITDDRGQAKRADAIVLRDYKKGPGIQRPPRQVWVLYVLESPQTTRYARFRDVFNWTATYRSDSDIVTPYERWVYYDERVKQNPRTEHNYAANKTRKVAWFVSNCHTDNRRLQYAHELQKHIPVDIYGRCGTFRCPRSDANRCLEMMGRDYKFYLAFENSNCRDYITEKFFVNGLGRNVLPIVMGARPEDYARNAPYRSYIHVDEFESPKELAAYLHQLDDDDELYNTYFRWKGTGEFINTYFFCRMCALLHDDIPLKSYRDVNDWWRGPGICTSGSWRT